MLFQLNGQELTFFYIFIDQMSTIQVILVVNIFTEIFGSALFSKNGPPRDFNSRALNPKSGGG